MITELSYDKAKELLERAVEEKGADYVYPIEHRERAVEDGTCQYFVDGEPSCIVGHVFSYLGFTEASAVIEKSSASEAASALGIKVPANVRTLLNHAQDSQDNGQTWGRALAEALTYGVSAWRSRLHSTGS